MGEIAKEGGKEKAIMLSLAVAAGVLLIAVLALIFVPMIIKHNNTKSMVSFNIAPQSATIEVNGKEYPTGAHELEPGKYSAKISKAGFTSKEIQFEVKEHETTVVNDYILGEDGFEYFEYSNNDIEVLRRVNDVDAKDFISKFDQKLKIRDSLPIEGNFDMNAGKPGMRSLFLKYKITNGEMSGRCKKVFCIIVYGYQSGKDGLEKAVAKDISDANFNVEDYEVVYDLE